MEQLTSIQKAIIQEMTESFVNKNIVRRVIKVRDERFDVNRQAFEAQIDILADMNLIEKNGFDRIRLTKKGHYLSEDYFIGL